MGFNWISKSCKKTDLLTLQIKGNYNSHTADIQVAFRAHIGDVQAADLIRQ